MLGVENKLQGTVLRGLKVTDFSASNMLPFIVIALTDAEFHHQLLIIMKILLIMVQINMQAASVPGLRNMTCPNFPSALNETVFSATLPLLSASRAPFFFFFQEVWSDRCMGADVHVRCNT